MTFPSASILVFAFAAATALASASLLFFKAMNEDPIPDGWLMALAWSAVVCIAYGVAVFHPAETQ